MTRLVLAMSLAAALGLFPPLSWAQDRSIPYYPDQRKVLTIDARSVSVNDQDQTATFSGAVVTNGIDHRRCASLIIHYYSGGPGNRGGIDRIECVSDYVHLID
jgi:lipopolysaccharide export system protein LptA